MDLQKAVDVTKRYVVRESAELAELKTDVLRIEQILTKAQVDQKSKVLQQYYENRAKKEERISERIERRLNKWIERLEAKLTEEEKKLLPEDLPALENLRQQLGIYRKKLIRILADSGELHQLIIQKAARKEVEEKIEEAFGNARSPGIRSLLLLLHDLEYQKKDEEIKVVIGVRIPPGFTVINVNVVHSYPPEKIRWLQEYPFLFNPADPGYLAYLEKCREDTKALAKYLHYEASKRDLPFWLKTNRIFSSKKGDREMSFLIRPPYFSSKAKKDETTRMQADESRDNFILHFDQNHRLQEIRYWEAGNQLMTIFRAAVARELSKNKLILGNNYGHWNVMAAKIVNAVEATYAVLRIK